MKKKTKAKKPLQCMGYSRVKASEQFLLPVLHWKSYKQQSKIHST